MKTFVSYCYRNPENNITHFGNIIYPSTITTVSDLEEAERFIVGSILKGSMYQHHFGFSIINFQPIKS